MRDLLYILTMLLNIMGVLFSISMFFVLKSASIIYLPLIFLSISIFTFSFGITFLDFNKKISRKNKYVFYKPQITDYREYFSQRRNEFLV